jgi:outer membrane protein OmpA-like peptidoglycan-associated protein
MTDTETKGCGLARRGAPWLAVLSVLALAACSSTPDWANPVEWYKGATSIFDDKPAPPPANEAAAEMAKEPIPGAGEPFPNLASVPERPKSVTPADERKKITEALVSDRANARYVDGPSSTRATPIPGADVAAAPRPPVSSEPMPPPPAAIAPRPPVVPSAAPPSPSSRSPAASSAAPAPAPPSPPQVASAPPPRPPAEPGAPRSLGRLVVGPTGEVKEALPGDGSALPNTAAAPPASSFAASSTAGQPVAVVLFNDGATQLSPEQRQGLGPVAREATARGATVRIVGHASPPKDVNSEGSLVNNFHAALDRAQSVASALIRLGVPASQVRVDADTSPDSAIDVANVPSGDAGMRRADIFLE